MLNDPIADMLTRIRNILGHKHRFVDVGFSKLNIAILTLLKEEGFVQNFLVQEELRLIRIFPKYDSHRKPLITGLKRVSSPGRRMYVKWSDVPVIHHGLGLAVVSTSRGIMSGKSAREQRIGGELICYVC